MGKILWRRDRLPTPVFLGFPSGSAGKEFAGRPGFHPWVGKIPWRRERLPTPVFWPREFYGLSSPWGRKELDTTERLSLWRAVMGRRRGDRVGCGDDDNVPFHYLDAQVFSLCETLS